MVFQIVTELVQILHVKGERQLLAAGQSIGKSYLPLPNQYGDRTGSRVGYPARSTILDTLRHIVPLDASFWSSCNVNWLYVVSEGVRMS